MDGISVTLPKAEWESVIRCIRHRQDDCRKVHEGDPQYPLFNELDLILEPLKMKIAKQI